MAVNFDIINPQTTLENVLSFFKNPSNLLSGFAVLKKDLYVLEDRLNVVDRYYGIADDSTGVQLAYKLLGWLPTELTTNMRRLESCLQHITNGVPLGDHVNLASDTLKELRDGLHEKLRLHVETISLMGDYLHRECHWHDENLRSKRSQQDAGFADHEIEIEEKLCQFLNCEPSELTEPFPAQRSFHSPSIHWSSRAAISSPMRCLHERLQDIMTPVGELELDDWLKNRVKIALYWFSNASKASDHAAFPFPGQRQAQQAYLDLMKGAWIAYYLRKHECWRNEFAGAKSLVSLILERISAKLKTYGDHSLLSLQSPEAGEDLNFQISTPVQAALRCLPVRSQSQASLSNHTWRSPVGGSRQERMAIENTSFQQCNRFNANLADQQPIHAQSNPESVLKFKVETMSPKHQNGFQGTIYSMLPENHFSSGGGNTRISQLRVIKHFSKTNHSFRISVGQGEHVDHEEQFDCQNTKIGLEYAFADRPCLISLRSQGSNGMQFRFQSNDWSGLMRLQSVFTSSVPKADYERLERLCFYRTKSPPGPIHNNPMVQIWTKNHPNLPPKNPAGACLGQMEAFEDCTDLSRIVLFSNNSIFTIDVCNQLESRMEEPRTFIIIPRRVVRNAQIHTHTIIGTLENPAGISLSQNLVCFTSYKDENTQEYQQVQMVFKTEALRNRFAADFDNLQKQWAHHATKLYHKREMQRCPNIRARGKFRLHKSNEP